MLSAPRASHRPAATDTHPAVLPVVTDLDGIRSLMELRTQCGASACDSDRAWNSLCYQLFDMRCGMYAAIEPGRGLLVLAPLCNEAYCNESRALGDARQTCEEQQRHFPPSKRQRLRHPSSWSFNGPLIDNWTPSVPWGASWSGRVARVLDHAAKQMPSGAVREVLFNPRDYPQLEINMRRPSIIPRRGTRGWRRHSRPWACYSDGRKLFRMLPVLSQYTRPGSVDTPVPPLRCCDDVAVRAPPWEHRKPQLVFRGSATSPHRDDANKRMRAVRLLARSPHANAALTSPSYRFRIDARGIHSSAAARTGLDPELCGEWMDMHEQARYRMGLYIEGNSGADRLAAMLGATMLVVTVRSDLPAVCWLRDGTLVAGQHYVACDSVEELPSLVAAWAARPDDAMCIAERGRAAWDKHMQREAVVDAYARAIAGPLPPPLFG